MKPNHKSFPHLLTFFGFAMFFLASFSNVVATGVKPVSDKKNPFTPKASLISYWKKKISNDLPTPWFFLNKASPLTPIQLATFSKLDSLSTNLPTFCKSANLLCFPELSPTQENHLNKLKFSRYSRGSTGHTYDPNAGDGSFSNYGKNGNGAEHDFKIYVQTPRVSFKRYKTSRGMVKSGDMVEPGKFFREKMLKSGVVMPMPDIRDKMPKRSFLPRVISSKLPFSTSKVGELKKIVHAGDDSTMNSMMVNAMSECERAPSPGENKRCVGSAEDMIDFAMTVLGRNVAVGTTENTNGSKGNIMIGSVKRINGGKVTKAVSCHQSLFPYLLYYCHSVPKVRVYEADLLDPVSKAKMNHGVAICHVDTSLWSSNHEAFLALGSGPGKIEVCHWIFENDMTWTVVAS